MKRIFILFLACTVLAGCQSNDEKKKEPTRTVLIYMVADNNLSSWAESDILEMESAWNDSYKGDLLVFRNTTGGNSTLYRICKSTDPETICSAVVKEYPTGSKVCTKDFLRQVINDVMTLYPADSYGLGLWSHGRGWLPKSQKSPLNISGEAVSGFISVPMNPSEEFGTENYNGGYFEADDLADALSPYHFDFIYMDACHMGSIECAYQMRNHCDYYIASAGETMVQGFPYDLIVADMFSQPANVVGMAQKFYEYYDAKVGSPRTATIAVVDTDELEDVAYEMSRIVTQNPTVPFLTIQQYGRSETKLDNCLFDLEDFAEKTWGSTSTSEFSRELSEAVIYKAATPMLLNEIPIFSFCGLSCYIPKEGQTNTYSEFKTYDWAVDSGLDKMLN